LGRLEPAANGVDTMPTYRRATDIWARTFARGPTCA
jgi:hypothetical protein